jgi:TonB-dependent SusC/RagA subfamily outer membrane receptor
MAVIKKDFTDADLEALKSQLKEKGITIKFKGIKRNSDNEITAIKIDVSSKKSNANYHTESDNAIRPIKIGFDSEGGSLSIGNSGESHSGKYFFSAESKDGNHKNHTIGNADHVFVIEDNDNDDDEHDEKTVIRKADKVHQSPKTKGKVHFVSEDDHVTKIEDKNIIISESESGDVDTIHVKRLNKANAIWVTKTDNTKVYAFENNRDNKLSISTIGEKTPLFILNGKEISKKEMDELKQDSIEKIEVLKGDSATEKYGEKGKDGVILITTKDEE